MNRVTANYPSKTEKFNCTGNFSESIHGTNFRKKIESATERRTSNL